MPYCPYCGSETTDGDRFCKSCGAMLGNGSAPKRQPDGSAKIKVIAVILVGIILISGASGIVAYFFMHSIGGDFDNTYKWTYDGHSFSYELKVERSYYNKMVNSDIDRSGSISSDRYTDESGDVVFAVSDYVVVDSHIRKISADLATLYEDTFGTEPSNDDYVNFVTAFVQICISYDYNEANGGKEYWRYPLETLCDRTGDCEDTSILLAALIDAHGLKAGVVLAPGHAMCAICVSEVTGPYENQMHSPINYNGGDSGVDYYLMETTYDDAHIIGDIVEDYTIGYLHLYLGYSTEYYVTS